MNRKMDRSQFKVSSHQELEKQDKEYWANATSEEKLETITYLRECFYGPEATTGRLQRVYQVLKLS
jgi:hypothetical protein